MMRWVFYASVPIAFAIAISCSSKDNGNAIDAGTSGDAASADGGGEAETDAGAFVCPVTEPRAGDTCDWPPFPDLGVTRQCPHPDQCNPTCKSEGADCINGTIEISSCDYALECPNAPPVAKDHCLCAPGYYTHIPGEGQPCSYKCENDGGHYVALCDKSTDEWIVSETSGCVPIARDGGAGSASDAAIDDASDDANADAGTD
jgi:hypothetical protein